MIGIAENDLGVQIPHQIALARTPLTAACVPTGMNTGVSTSPCAVCRIPALAPV